MTLTAVQKELKRQAKEALDAERAKRARPAEDVNESEELSPFTQYMSTTKGRSSKWYTVQGRNLLGLSGGRSKRPMHVEYWTFFSPTGEEVHMAHLSHKQSWLSTLCGGSLKRTTHIFDRMRQLYRLAQVTELAKQRRENTLAKNQDDDANEDDDDLYS